MAICSGALRTYLAGHDELPDDPLRAMVPVSIRTFEEDDPWTNRVSSIFVELPTDVADPVDRVATVHEAMEEAKHRFELLPAELIIDIASAVPGALSVQAARLATNPRIADRSPLPSNVVISNVPGPREPLYLGSARLTHYIPVSTVVDGQGLNITVQSYDDVLDFGFVACRELVPDLEHLADLHLAEIDVLAEAAGLTPTSHGVPS
jgi:WS/DGAT/MGAT family acyltransferase